MKNPVSRVAEIAFYQPILKDCVAELVHRAGLPQHLEAQGFFKETNEVYASFPLLRQYELSQLQELSLRRDVHNYQANCQSEDSGGFQAEHGAELQGGRGSCRKARC